MEGSAALIDQGGAPAETVDAVREAVAVAIAPDVERIDREGLYPAAGLRAIGAAGGFAAHLEAHTRLPGRSLSAAIGDMATVGETCMSTAFCVWWPRGKGNGGPLEPLLAIPRPTMDLYGGTVPIGTPRAENSRQEAALGPLGQGVLKRGKAAHLST